MNKYIKRIFSILLIAILLTTVNCFAVNITTENIVSKNGTTYLYKTYEVQEKEETKFISNLENQITIDEKNYVIDSINKLGGNITDTIDIQTTQEITTKNNILEDILSELPQTIDYKEDGYIGQYEIDINSIETTTQYNGTREYLVEDTKQYFDLNKNDLSFIPKQVIKDGITLDLLKIDWYEQTTKLVGENIVPDKYRAECYYASKKRVDNPYTYFSTVTYIGTATKIVEKPFIYELEYKCITLSEENKSNYIPYIVGGTGTIFTAVAIFFKRKSKKNEEATSK